MGLTPKLLYVCFVLPNLAWYTCNRQVCSASAGPGFEPSPSTAGDPARYPHHHRERKVNVKRESLEPPRPVHLACTAPSSPSRRSKTACPIRRRRRTTRRSSGTPLRST